MSDDSKKGDMGAFGTDAETEGAEGHLPEIELPPMQIQDLEKAIFGADRQETASHMIERLDGSIRSSQEEGEVVAAELTSLLECSPCFTERVSRIVGAYRTICAEIERFRSRHCQGDDPYSMIMHAIELKDYQYKLWVAVSCMGQQCALMRAYSIDGPEVQQVLAPDRIDGLVRSALDALADWPGQLVGWLESMESYMTQMDVQPFTRDRISRDLVMRQLVMDVIFDDIADAQNGDSADPVARERRIAIDGLLLVHRAQETLSVLKWILRRIQPPESGEVATQAGAGVLQT